MDETLRPTTDAQRSHAIAILRRAVAERTGIPGDHAWNLRNCLDGLEGALVLDDHPNPLDVHARAVFFASTQGGCEDLAQAIGMEPAGFIEAIGDETAMLAEARASGAYPTMLDKDS